MTNDHPPASERAATDENRQQDGLTVSQFQSVIHKMFFEKDQSRGLEGTFMWFMEEVGELSSALRENDDPQNLEEEFADVLAWLATMANVAGVDLERAISRKYVQGCPRCNQAVCTCDLSWKP
ncbi:MazG nucleotide pyrophosphohydrolase domain protein [Gimesia panareensis]|uniref:MazG nucleotide pyrophosphohydrolase domain protein n=1 Tax=Gimesia panareensis TaxID=2527978 RepID=A0A518FQZ6_9PLAN|nr:MazG nucleotide pyrophosphohydrolase domain-containing protein [Gimesia panareensis]QDV18715.1 MazG nucleotide pyrophosphohydrolase domain protein [Gimesia panareensis]